MVTLLKLIYIHSKGTLLVTYKQDQSSPWWDTWSNKDLIKEIFQLFFKLFNSVGAILYGGIDIGQFFGTTSIPKSISLRKTLDRSSGKTSGYFFTTETKWIWGILTLESLTWNKWYTHPLETNFLALRYKIEWPLAQLNYFSTLSLCLFNGNCHSLYMFLKSLAILVLMTLN